MILPFSIPILMSSFNLIKADCVRWCFLNPVWKVANNPLPLRNVTIWSWASFSIIFEKKVSKTIDLKKVGMCWWDWDLFRAITRAFFQECGNTPGASDALKSFVRWETIVGSTLAITLWGIPSSPLAYGLKWETSKNNIIFSYWLKKEPSKRDILYSVLGVF